MGMKTKTWLCSNLLTPLLFLVFVSSMGQASARDLDYLGLREAIKSGDADFDPRELRLKYIESGTYMPYQSDPMPLLGEFFNRKFVADKAFASEVADFVDDHFAIVTSHVVYLEVLKPEPGSREDKTHRGVLTALLRSILEDGDGKAMESAYPVLAISEENMILSRMERESAQQSLVENKGHYYDVIEAKSKKDGSVATVWFDVSPFFGESWR